MSARLLRVDARAPVSGAPAEPCAMASLVEAGRDGRLGEREEASMARHLATCGTCRTLARDLDEVRTLLRRPAGGPITSLDHQRGRLSLLRAASAPPPADAPAPPRRSGRSRLVVTLAAAVVALAAVALFWHRPVPVPVAQHLPALQLHLAALTAADLVPPRETTVRGSPAARFERRTVAEVERVALSEGTLDLTVRKLGPGERFLVVTDDAEVEVRGTVFQVEAHAGHVTYVSVSEGKVEVRYGPTITLVPAGGEWRPAVAAGPSSAGGPSTPAPTKPSPARIAAAVAASGTKGGASPRAPAEPSPPDEGGASRSFARAVDLIARGDYAAAGSELQAFHAAHPGDGRADLAAFLTIVSLQRAGRRGEAQDAARRYLELYPEGDRRADVLRVANGR